MDNKDVKNINKEQMISVSNPIKNDANEQPKTENHEVLSQDKFKIGPKLALFLSQLDINSAVKSKKSK